MRAIAKNIIVNFFIPVLPLRMFDYRSLLWFLARLRALHVFNKFDCRGPNRVALRELASDKNLKAGEV